jgi:hypothetical protein
MRIASVRTPAVSTIAGRSRRALFSRVASVAIAAALVALTGATPAHASQQTYYAFGVCTPLTVVSVTTSTWNATHVNKQGSLTRETSWDSLFILIPETRRAYPNWKYVNSTYLYTSGSFSGHGRECG